MLTDNELFYFDEGFDVAIRLIDNILKIYEFSIDEKKAFAPIRAHIEIAKIGRRDVDKFIGKVIRKE